jgi:thiol-disulfide isomerase/thioredoxin
MKRMLTIVSILSLLCAVAAPLDALEVPAEGAAEKSSFLSEYETFSAAIEAKMAGIKSRGDYDKLMAERKSGLEALLEQHASDPASDPVELLRARILVDLNKYPEAEAKLNALIAGQGARLNEARLLLAEVLTETERMGQAVPLFQLVEGQVARTDDFFAVAMTLAFEAPDAALRQEYCRKLLAAPDLPKKFSEYRVYLVTTLAEIELQKRNVEAAKKILQEGLKTFTGEKDAKSLQSALRQLEFIGRPAPAIAAEHWLNGDPLRLDSLKGKVVIIDFWAPWCPPCRKVIPTLAKDFNEFREQGLVVIGFTKLYGSYRDDVQNKGKVEADDEKALIQEFVERNGLKYPIAISNKGENFNDYGISGIPTMVFIDKAGNIYDIKVGSGNESEITAKIKLLLAAK